MSILEVETLSKSYQLAGQKLQVLDQVSFRIESGTTVSLVGPSGSGKTTLLGLCAGLDRPSTGSIRLDGRELTTLDEHQLAALRNVAVGFVFQSFHLISSLTALENVLLPAELHGRYDATADAEQLLTRVGLANRMHHYPTQLSGGEQQRVAIARAYINRPKILFADEPTGNLDGETAKTIEDLLFELNASEGTTLVMATHNLDLAARTNRKLMMKAGVLHEETNGY